MKVARKTAIVTGGGGGIGGALAARLARDGARVVVADLDAQAATAVAEDINADQRDTAVSVGADASDTAEIQRLIRLAESEFGPVDLYFANAGITGAAGLDVSESDWDRSLDVNLRAHIRAARLLVPGWVERGEGYFVSTASAAGLLTQLGSATYSVTKHAAVGFAEWLNITYGDKGVRVSCLCPMGVNTKLLYSGEQSGDPLGDLATRAVTTAGEVLEPSKVADSVLAAIEEERFLILPHPEVLDMYRQKAADYDRWLRGMRRYQRTLLGDNR
ncbi:SDR family oxidoreductase [Mycobacterium xenopi]|uniref:Short chain dehydrogenase/reductase n=2 Tax=Mycobacterium xenopi TaxID=1789 RepID=A0AAD1H2Y7_MYCXE|nr:SDR family NAD(P)-dependent oxidoreductase [Mycobacterium xenopi]EUA54782.1 short chain dehydrogenase family protein [Mycobacterium xenopi 4042]MDA3639445.1 SDR family NAD(P)-dependent oxidoreductase [Mycobacterium xenopi]MDA3658277.1 SDR family NAD(P)-dependent oxidoreductase [Mycobacterium xenopi]MDA3662032.1 SDR family NAD(P)-dependent oxidoreductase [Mycobacterium xenopi]ORX15849.1 dehydrogenase [Mycobacterium xenopi]